MSVQELKDRVIEQINGLTDEADLQAVLDAVEQLSVPRQVSSGPYVLTAEQNAELRRRAASIRHGDLLTQEQVQHRRKAFWKRYGAA